ncbi:hypothetical protein EC973_004985 [Apophysomyces ossiformis]|uniref:Mitochondrial import protein 1 n=1 Tax=Apophysomyces ossiformis TaxID=679940 RepID=A0A8H7BJK6_9FUNG|nr:hypothetical protein EC973_004985 [Apophysomyces ossiformis]
MSTPYELSTVADFDKNNTATLIPLQRETQLVRQTPWYQHPTLLWILRSTAVNFILPFFNGVMLGFGEILANELVFKFGWFGFSRVSPSTTLGLRPGVPPSSTVEYKKAMQSEMRRLEKQME